jgi:hypothetical protein
LSPSPLNGDQFPLGVLTSTPLGSKLLGKTPLPNPYYQCCHYRQPGDYIQRRYQEYAPPCPPARGDTDC